MSAAIVPFPRVSPSVPPGHPLFRTILSGLASATGRDGAAAVAQLCRQGARDIRAFVDKVAMADATAVDHMIAQNLRVPDLDDLADYLEARAIELDPPRRAIGEDAIEFAAFTLFLAASLASVGVWSLVERLS